MAIAAIVAVVLSPVVSQLLGRGQQVTVSQQTVKIQEAVNAWVAQQPTLAAAASQFQAASDGTLVPKDPAAFATLINQYFMTDNDSVQVDSSGHFTTGAMTSAGCYLDLTWPQPYRLNYPRVNLHRPQ